MSASRAAPAARRGRSTPWTQTDKATGRRKKRTLKIGETVVEAKSENTPAVIAAVKNKILSDSWADLSAHVNA